MVGYLRRQETKRPTESEQARSWMLWRSGWHGECVYAAGVETQIPGISTSLQQYSIKLRKCDVSKRYQEVGDQLNSGR